MEKECIKCNVFLPLDNFHKSNASCDGHINTCKICKKEFNKKYSNVSKKQKDKEYYLKNKEIIRIKQKLWSENNKDKKKQININWAKNNPDKIKETGRKATQKWRENNPEKSKESTKKYYLNNKHRHAYRYILKNTLTRLGRKKEGHTIDLLGYSAIELKGYITKLFTESMTWDNYGEWHIDHIKPVSSFPIETSMNVVNALSNLQPLWATTREINGVTYLGNLNKNKNL